MKLEIAIKTNIVPEDVAFKILHDEYSKIDLEGLIDDSTIDTIEQGGIGVYELTHKYEDLPLERQKLWYAEVLEKIAELLRKEEE